MASSSSSSSSGCSSSFQPLLFSDDLFTIDADEGGPTAQIFEAAWEGDIPGMRKLAEQRRREGKSVEVVEGIKVKDTRNSLLGALHVAASAGKLDMCRFLIKDLRLNVNAAAEHGSSPLLCAIYGVAPKLTVKLLLDRGANPNLTSRGGYTVLHVLATKQDPYGIADILLSRGADVNSMSEHGTPLHLAAQCGNVGMVEVLLKYKANPNTVVRLFYAPLTLALYASSLKCVELLIKADADVNAGWPVTPLIVAANDGLSDCIECLLKARADPNIPDEIGRMPVELAAIHGSKKCVEILFPVTSRVARFADWSVDGIMQHVKPGSSEGHPHKNEEPALKALGDAAFERKDYAHASALYTKAMETDPKDSTLYAKRSRCWLNMGERDKALDDANTFKAMGLDVSNCCHEQGAALILTEDYAQACKALISSLKLDSGSGSVGEVSRGEDK